MNMVVSDVISDQGPVETARTYVGQTMNMVASDVISDQGPVKTMHTYVGQTMNMVVSDVICFAASCFSDLRLMLKEQPSHQNTDTYRQHVYVSM